MARLENTVPKSGYSTHLDCGRLGAMRQETARGANCRVVRRAPHGRIAFLVLLASSSWQLGAQEIAKDRFVEEYRGAVKKLREANKTLRFGGTYRGQVTNTKRPAKPGANERFTQYEYAANGNLEKLGFFRSEPQPFGRVVVANGEQSFVLRRNGKDSPLYLEFKNPGEPFTKFMDDFRSEVVNAAYSAAWIDLSQAIESNVFTIGSIKKVDDGGRPCQRVDFEYKPPEGRISHATGWLLLDPDRHWIVRQFEMREEFRNGGIPLKANGRNEYSDGQGLPELRKVDFKQVVEDKFTTTRTLLFEVSSWCYEAAPPREFTLDAYGLGSAESSSPAAKRKN
jgi:hypothetical protein